MGATPGERGTRWFSKIDQPFSIADRIAEATQEAIIREARTATPRVHPVVVSLGGLLVRIGERLEATGTARQRREYA